ncbi:MAG TPA: nucleoid-structuring protein H-NS, partial [Myxococcota bacterium]|nr:nucleoid-structuring protein H-NS [Myxococcota bacterium]
MGLDYRVRCCPEGLVTDRRRRIKVLDCTIRDGGICNNWRFDRAWVKRSFEALQAAGVDYMEIGYRTREGAFDRSKVGEWRFLEEEVLAEVTAANNNTMKIAAMLDVGRVDPGDIKRRGETVVNTIRIATYAHQIKEARRLLDKALEEGYETFMNVMAVSTLEPAEVDAFLD